jgi:hypothetical protein
VNRSLLALAGVLAGCVPFHPGNAPIGTSQQAIAIAERVCRETWEKLLYQNGRMWNLPPEKWHARLQNHLWLAFSDKDEAHASFTMTVPESSNGPGDCLAYFPN